MEITATTADAGGTAIHLGSSAISPTTCCVRNVLKSTNERDQEERGSKNEGSPSYLILFLFDLIHLAQWLSLEAVVYRIQSRTVNLQQHQRCP
jgi:hypothetical protein